MCLYVCAYMYACMYVYVCICMCVYVCVYVCIYAYMHACIFVSSSSSTAMGSAPVGVQCQFPLLPPTSSVRRHLCIFVYVCIIHIYVLGEMSDEKMSYSKREEELSGGELSGGELSGGELSGGLYCPTYRSSIAKLQICAIYSKIPTRAWMIGVLWTWKQSMASPWMTCIVEVRFQNTCRCDKRGEKTHEVYNCD